MPAVDTSVIVLAAIASFAALVNGAIGYGFSSLTVPVALVFYTNRILNPAVVVIEIFINLYVLIINRKGVPTVWRRVFPILMGLLPGIGVGSFALASLDPGWIKFGTYTVILPLILVQAAGWRRPIESKWAIGLPFGSALGVLYSVTTISGPPLAILFNNQGLVKDEFRASLALVRVAESSATAVVYYHVGLFVTESQSILPVFIGSVVLGIPIGAYVIRHLDAETFRRICMSFDAWVVGFGLSRVLIDLSLMESPWAYSVMAVTILIDGYLLYVFFSIPRGAPNQLQAARTAAIGSGGAARSRFLGHDVAVSRPLRSAWDLARLCHRDRCHCDTGLHGLLMYAEWPKYAADLDDRYAEVAGGAVEERARRQRWQVLMQRFRATSTWY